MNPKLSIKNLYFTYGDGTEALKNISVDIFNNEIFVLFGPARSGKTTLLRLLNRLSDLIEHSQYQGTILFNGNDIFERNVDVTQLRRRISMVFAIPTPLPGTIRDNLTYGLKMAGLRDQVELERRVERALQQAAL
jgi:phosphate transport system ATP-binding protein